VVAPEAQLRDDGAGLMPASLGWFVLNARKRALVPTGRRAVLRNRLSRLA
jgi:hypothetical protein